MPRRRGGPLPASLLSLLLAAAASGCSPSSGPAGAPASAPVLRDPPPHLLVDGRRLQVGFGAKVELKARVDDHRRWRFRWRQVWGPPAKALRSRPDGLLQLRTPGPPEGHGGGGLIDFGAKGAGRMVFRLEATAEDGQRVGRLVEVIPAFPSPGWPRLALGVWSFLREGAGPAWQAAPGGRLELAATPHAGLRGVRARAVGWWHLARGATRLTVRAGPWLGSEDCGRFDCHPREHSGWRETGHATIFQRGIEGELRQRHGGRYDGRCIACHTLGFQQGADNDGFDDRAKQLGWQLPAPARGNWAYLPARLKQRANVQCESCHGPGWFYTGYSEMICAQCHGHPPEYPIVSQCRRNRMSRAHTSAPADDRACGGCHRAAGFLQSIRGHRSGSKPGRDLDTRAHGVTCAVCHDPHGADCKRQLRFCGTVETPGLTFDAGQGALCIACHTGEANVVRGALLRPFIPASSTGRGAGHAGRPVPTPREAGAAPHAPQFQLLTGRGGKFLELPKRAVRRAAYPHAAVPDSCVGCHYSRDQRGMLHGGHVFKLLDRIDTRPALSCRATRRIDLAPIARSHVTYACRKCHGAAQRLDLPARGDYDGDGKVRGLVHEVQRLLQLLADELARQIAAAGWRDRRGREARWFAVVDERLLAADARCQPLAGPVTLAARSSLLHKAAFNLVMVLRDGSGGLHNPQYTVRLLQSTIEGLERARGAAPHHGWKRP